MALQEELTGTEGRIAYARQFYNDTVYRYNTKVQSFPQSVIANMFKFRRSSTSRPTTSRAARPRCDSDPTCTTRSPPTSAVAACSCTASSSWRWSPLFSYLLRGGSSASSSPWSCAAIASFTAYWKSDAVALRVSRARPASVEDYARYHNLVEGLCIASGLPKPRLYVIEDPAPAFATGRNRLLAVAVTTGLLEMNRMELEGVLARAVAHPQLRHSRLDAGRDDGGRGGRARRPRHPLPVVGDGPQPLPSSTANGGSGGPQGDPVGVRVRAAGAGPVHGPGDAAGGEPPARTLADVSGSR